jgi:hypothetical protein
MFNNKKRFLLAFTSAITLNAIAQTVVADTSSENGFMRSEGKIYVVMVVVITILAGLILYVSRIDRKLSKLEKGQSL